MPDRNYPMGSRGLWEETFKEERKVKCEICGEYFKEFKLNSLYSRSESGESILTLICDLCASDETKLEKLILEKDNLLEMPSKIQISS